MIINEAVKAATRNVRRPLPTPHAIGQAHLDRLSAFAIDVLGYRHLIRFAIEEPLAHDIQVELKRLNGGGVDFYTRDRFANWPHVMLNVCAVQGPQRAFLERCHDLLDRRHLTPYQISRTESAIDVLFPHQAQAVALFDHAIDYMVKPHARNYRPIIFTGKTARTFYSDWKGRPTDEDEDDWKPGKVIPRSFTAYADRVSDIDGQSAAFHFKTVLTGPKANRDHGMGTFRDILHDRNVENLVVDNLRMEAIADPVGFNVAVDELIDERARGDDHRDFLRSGFWNALFVIPSDRATDTMPESPLWDQATIRRIYASLPRHVFDPYIKPLNVTQLWPRKIVYSRTGNDPDHYRSSPNPYPMGIRC